MTALPAGTVTLLFTDIEGSTLLLRALGDEYGGVLELQRTVLRDVFERFGGYELGTEGDSFFVAFASAAQAVRACVESQHRLAATPWPDGVDVQVRMGLHSGEPTVRDLSYVGMDVHRAARIAATAHGGQIVLSGTTYELVADHLSSDLSVRDLGWHRLKDLTHPERILQMTGPGLRWDFPPLKSMGVATGRQDQIRTLPALSSEIVGREADLRLVVNTVRPTTVTSITGTGGVGKTRLALEAAYSLADRFPDGVWWCDLLATGDGESVAPMVAGLLSLRAQPGASALETIVDALRDRSALVVLDNCEHVVDAASSLAGSVAARCVTVAVLATSREPLLIEQERIVPLAPLEPASAGVDLFVRRADAVNPAADVSDRHAIGRLCARLDGLPLAIELAASRLRSMTVDDLSRSLDDRFRTLHSKRRDTADRHRTLGAMLDWSYGLLAVAERSLLDRLSVFAGTFDVADVQAVCSGFADVGDRCDDTLESLVDKSLVHVDLTSGTARFRLLETVRLYGRDHLVQARAWEKTASAHAAHFIEVAAQCKRLYEGSDYLSGKSCFEASWDDLRATALKLLDNGDRAGCEALLDGLGYFSAFELRDEVGEWCLRASSLTGAGPRTFGMAAGMLGVYRGDFNFAIDHARRGIERADDPQGPATLECWQSLFGALQGLGRFDEMFEAARCSADVAAKRGPFHECFQGAAVGMLMLVDRPRADELFARSQELAKELQHPILTTLLTIISGTRAFLTGDPSTAVSECRRALDTSIAMGMRWFEAVSATTLATFATVAPNEEQRDHFKVAIECCYRYRDWYDLWTALQHLAIWWRNNGHLEQATLLLACLTEHHVASSLTMPDPSHDLDEIVRLNPEVSPIAEQGKGMSRDHAVRFALRELSAS